MKKLMTIALASLLSLSAHASLSKQCINSMDDVVVGRQQTVDMAQSGKITEGEAGILFNSWDLVAQSSALTCAGLKMIELERSVAGKLGLITRAKAERIAEETFEEAMNYYNDSIR